MALPCMGHHKLAMPLRGHAFRWQPAPWVASAFDWYIHLVHSPGAIWCNLGALWVQTGCIMGAFTNLPRFGDRCNHGCNQTRPLGKTPHNTGCQGLAKRVLL